MNPGTRLVGLSFLSLAIAGGALAQSNDPVLSNCNQLVVVVTKGWDAVPGKMILYQRNDKEGGWRKIGKSFPVVVGRNGGGR